MITQEQYEDIKKFALDLLSKANTFWMSPTHFCHKFGLSSPFYGELKTMIEADGAPFLLEDTDLDANGDPAETIVFSRKK